MMRSLLTLLATSAAVAALVVLAFVVAAQFFLLGSTFVVWFRDQWGDFYLAQLAIFGVAFVIMFVVNFKNGTFKQEDKS